MAKGKAPAGAAGAPFAARAIGYAGLGLSALGALACLLAAIQGAVRGEKGGTMLLAGLLFLPVAALAVVQFLEWLRLKDWTVAPEVPLGLKVLGHLGRIIGALAVASCIVLAVVTIVASSPPRPGLAAIFVLGIFASLLVRALGNAISELRTWARAGSLVVMGVAVALLTVALIFNLTLWKSAGATLPLAIFLGSAAVLFLFLLVYFMLPSVVEAFESRRL